MLDKLMKADWETNGRTIQTRAGQYLGTAKSEELAEMMVAASKLMRFLMEKHDHCEEVKSELKRFLQD